MTQQTKHETRLDEQFQQGLAVRKRVMGEGYVDAAFAAADDFTRPIQEFITRNAWGTVWCRDALAMDTRSLITLAMLIAQGRQQEIKGHVRGALNNGVSADALRELLLHAAVYCGAPLALDATRAVNEVLREQGAGK
ncbi:MAG: carboxymuconolactone decarboxylase family protein [Pseudomonadota bacterium]|nr:carboxymuconolactone decarboxylase family protein [Pseudomonadota bacterium]